MEVTTLATIEEPVLKNQKTYGRKKAEVTIYPSREPSSTSPGASRLPLSVKVTIDGSKDESDSDSDGSDAKMDAYSKVTGKPRLEDLLKRVDEMADEAVDLQGSANLLVPNPGALEPVARSDSMSTLSTLTPSASESSDPTRHDKTFPSVPALSNSDGTTDSDRSQPEDMVIHKPRRKAILDEDDEQEQVLAIKVKPSTPLTILSETASASFGNTVKPLAMDETRMEGILAANYVSESPEKSPLGKSSTKADSVSPTSAVQSRKSKPKSKSKSKRAKDQESESENDSGDEKVKSKKVCPCFYLLNS